MLYTVITDKDSYIINISHTNNDNIDIDIESIEPLYLSAYRLLDGSIVLDENRKAQIIEEKEREEKNRQIEELINQLESTNDDMLDFVEQLCSLNNPLTFVADLIALMKNYSALVLARQNIRQEIKELQK